ncbi:diacylglycerol kinase family protein [Aureimonas sp. AU40]|uniref:diacylglycerol kinase family protein n=1 Tax=Aureimonas sp. AU40 TaxID=1637747 RepID=UPI000A6D8F5C|nr:diacylglycerol kinase family protein [Aureimonas sp. AU40]
MNTPDLGKTTSPAPALTALQAIWRKRIGSFGHAFSGIGYMVATQPHARFHLLAVAVVAPVGWSLSITVADWMILALACGFVLAMEAVNTAMEHLCDVVCPAWSESVRRTKDVAAGAVLLAAVTAAIVGLLVVAKNLA